MNPLIVAAAFGGVMYVVNRMFTNYADEHQRKFEEHLRELKKLCK